jgi:hypothetical protein
VCHIASSHLNHHSRNFTNVILHAGVYVSEWRTIPALQGAIKSDANSITIPPQTLPKGGNIAVVATLSLGGEAVNGSTQLVIPVDQPPQCTAPTGSSCIEVQTISSIFPTSKVVVSAVGFADDGVQLKYELGSLGTGSRRRAVALGQQQSADVVGLPSGQITTYACATDDAGSELCHYENVTITEPESFDASESLTNFSLEDLHQKLSLPAAMFLQLWSLLQWHQRQEAMVLKSCQNKQKKLSPPEHLN